MDKKINFSGVTAVPSDYNCSDDDLAVSLNVSNVVAKGNLTADYPASSIGTVPSNWTFLCLHTSNEINNYIFYDGTKLHCCTDYDSTTKTWKTIADFGVGVVDGLDIYKASSVGYTLIVLTSDGVYYFLWKNNAYISLGNSMPECPISFGLQGAPKVYPENGWYSAGSVATSDRWGGTIASGIRPFPSDSSADIRSEVTTLIMGQVQKYIADNVTSQGKFIFPFFVRYAYRLFDGTLIKHSAPILMIPTSGPVPWVVQKDLNETTVRFNSVNIKIFSVPCELDYKILISYSELEMIKNWKDIIRSIDVFISAPVYTFDASGKCPGFLIMNATKDGYGNDEYNNMFTLSKSFRTILDSSGNIVHEGFGFVDSSSYEKYSYYQKTKLLNLWPLYYDNEAIPNLNRTDTTDYDDNARVFGLIPLPELSDSDLNTKLEDASTFYFLSSIPIEDIAIEDRKKVKFYSGHLNTLVNKEQMSDDYDSHDKLIPLTSMVYNNRLHLANITKVLFDGFDPASLVCFSDGQIYYNYADVTKDVTEGTTTKKVNIGISVSAAIATGVMEKATYLTVQLSIDSKEFVLKKPFSVNIISDDIFYIYQPNINAKKIFITSVMNGNYQSEEKLKAHSFLNGAYYFNNFISVDYDEQTVVPSATSNNRIVLSNRLYVSRVDNPLSFQASNIYRVGNGKILSLSSANKALSEGQFGVYPLYVFTDEGVWAMMLNGEGTYSSIHPVSRDVLFKYLFTYNSASPICQLDSAVAFITSRGIIIIEGSHTTCISDILDGPAFDITQLPHYTELLSAASLTLASVPTIRFREYLSGASITYDYAGQRIIAFNTAYPVAYVYNLRSKTWSTMQCNFQNVTNSYPDTVLQTIPYVSADGSAKLCDIINLSEPDYTASLTALVITRPLKLDAPDILKTVSDIIARGVFSSGKVSCVLYASRDMLTWMLVDSSVTHYLLRMRGTGYKYFRLVLIAKSLSRNDSIDSASLRFEPRETFKLR